MRSPDWIPYPLQDLWSPGTPDYYTVSFPDFGFPGMTEIPSGIDHRFNQTEGLLKQGADDGGPLFPKPLT